jgi:predicted permease
MRPDNLISAAVTLGRASYPEAAQRLAVFEQWEQRLRRIPGVAEVAVTNSLPPTNNLMGSMLYAAIDVRGRPRFTDGTGGNVVWRSVTPSYFSALGIPILRGRGFLEEDRDPDRNAIVLSDTLARRMFPSEDPLGKQIRPGRQGEWLTVVGVAGNVKNGGLMERDYPEYYVTRKHSSGNVAYGATAVIRAGMNPPAIEQRVRAEVAALDPTLPVEIETIQQRLSKLAERPRFNALLLGIFASLGLLLAAIGLYGVISFLVAQRSQEIGVRMALGAAPASITRLVLRQALLWTTAGGALGVVGSLFAVRLLDRMLFHVSAKDPGTLGAALAILVGVALAAAWIPSRRAARVDPMQVLRRE